MTGAGEFGLGEGIVVLRLRVHIGRRPIWLSRVRTILLLCSRERLLHLLLRILQPLSSRVLRHVLLRLIDSLLDHRSRNRLLVKVIFNLSVHLGRRTLLALHIVGLHGG